jgi:uncharacterized protein YdaL
MRVSSNSLLGVFAAALALSCQPVPPLIEEAPEPKVGDCADERPAASFERPVLVLYETTGAFGYLGAVHAQMVMNLLGHFREVSVTAKPRLDYNPGDLQAHDVTFVLGTSGDEAVPAGFVDDFWANEESTVVWLGFDLWQMVDEDDLDRDAGAFRARFGFTIDDEVDEGEGVGGCGDGYYRDIWFRGEAEEPQHFFKQNWLNSDSGEVECDPYITVVSDVGAAERVVDIHTRTQPVRTTPWILHQGVGDRHLWFITDVPFSYLHQEDRYIVFADQMHEFVGIDHTPTRTALARLEDVHPLVDGAALTQFADLMDDRPWTLALIAEFRDPLGVTHEGRPYYTHIGGRRARLLREAIDSVLEDPARDVGLLLHGYTHQYGFEANDFDGLTGNDYEFWDALHDTPLPDDSFGFVADRVGAAEFRAREVGWMDHVWGFEFPHYKASLTARIAASKHFCSAYHQGEYWDWSGTSDGDAFDFNEGFSDAFGSLDPTTVALRLEVAQSESQFFPYLIGRDVYGQRVVPENIGSFTPTLFAYDYGQVNEIDDMLRAARKNLVSNCATASFFFHPFLLPFLGGLEYGGGEESLRVLIDQLEAWDYNFVQARDLLAPEGIDRF